MEEWEWLWSSEKREWRGGVVSVIGSEGERRGVVVVVGDGK
jgi:hypothetical protein